jgi:hypothetical protein
MPTNETPARPVRQTITPDPGPGFVPAGDGTYRYTPPELSEQPPGATNPGEGVAPGTEER